MNGGSAGVLRVPYECLWCPAVRKGKCGEENNEGITRVWGAGELGMLQCRK